MSRRKAVQRLEHGTPWELVRYHPATPSPRRSDALRALLDELGGPITVNGANRIGLYCPGCGAYYETTFCYACTPPSLTSANRH